MKAIGLLIIALLVCSYGCTSTGGQTGNCINVTCNGVTICRDPANIPPCVPITPPSNGTSPTNSTTPVACVNVTCNGVTSCYPPDNTPPCAPMPSNQSSPCPDGYVCGIPSDGCAVPGAVYNCPNEPVNPPANSTVPTEAVNLTQELNNSASAGFSLLANKFHANSASECSKQRISPCDNNMPSQFICVNQQYADQISGQYISIYTTPQACPQFLEAGTISCGLDDGYCVVTYQGP